MAKKKDFVPNTGNLNTRLKELQKKHGAMTIDVMKNFKFAPVECISTGSLGLDLAIGPGGFPKGRICELWGLEAAGKTLTTLSAIANAQRNGEKAAFVDAEHAFNPVFAASLGVDVGELIYAAPDYGEQALEIVEALVESGEVSIVVVDSVSALVPQAEYEGEMGQSHVGVQARMMGQALRKLTPKVAKSKTCVIFINQIREKVGIMFGDPRTTSGGNALKFYASLRLECQRAGVIKLGEEQIGHRMKVTVKKNKVGVPFRSAEFDIIYEGGGIDRVGEILDFAELHGVVNKSGAWYDYKGERLGQGRDKTKAFLKKDGKDLYLEIEAQVKDLMIKKPTVVEGNEEDEEGEEPEE